MSEIANIPELSTAMAKVGLALADSSAIAQGFAPHFLAFREAGELALQVRPDQPQAARIVRLKLKDVRVASERTRKALKEDSLRRGQAIDGLQKVLEHALVPVEEAMREIEEAEARKEAKRKSDLAIARRAELAPYCETAHFALGDMPEADFQQLLSGAKAAKLAANEAAEKAEKERAAAATAAADAKAKQDAENEKQRAILAREAADLKALRDRLDAEARAAKAAAAALDAEKRELARKAQAEAEEREAAERARLKADADAARKAAAAPDKEKLLDFALAIVELKLPAMATPNGQWLAAKFQGELLELVERIQDAADNM